ncbi:hypothetical protein G6F57_020980 [Rhizopus arrhizus]|nr:hypothetical protein G6F57_020980 [Rhizopus arrhizus]
MQASTGTSGISMSRFAVQALRVGACGFDPLDAALGAFMDGGPAARQVCLSGVEHGVQFQFQVGPRIEAHAYAIRFDAFNAKLVAQQAEFLGRLIGQHLQSDAQVRRFAGWDAGARKLLTRRLLQAQRV